MELTTVVLASHNKGKVAELEALMKPFGIQVKSAGDFNILEPEETGATFEENAILKAKAAAEACKLPCIADDSGFAVEALGGTPGVFSKRFAKTEDGSENYEEAVKKLWSLLGDIKDDRAAFITCVAIAYPDGNVITAEGRIDGKMIRKGRGDQGFAYDPWFVPQYHDRTFAEMNQDEKNSMSHRGRALQELMRVLGLVAVDTSPKPKS